MIFDEWMKYKGLSQSSISKYSGAIDGVLSEWALDNGIISGPIKSISSKKNFQLIVQEISKLSIYIERNGRGHNMYSSALSNYAEFLGENFENDIESDIDEIFADTTVLETEKISLIKSRIGQGAFRQKLIGYWNCCSATKLKDTNFLIASHIKPWKLSNNVERLDVFNGLLLTPNLDLAFDSGLITFDENGNINISPRFSEPEKLGVTGDLHVSLAKNHEKYMSFHRNFVYLAV